MAYLILENGVSFEGKRIGADFDCIGELVFTTGMVGYLETLTDPSYAGQIVCQTFPLIGNYGVISQDFEGKTAVKGYIVRGICSEPSNFRSEYELDRFLKDNNIPGICGVDTRQITRLIRESGVMNAIICDKMPQDLKIVSDYKVTGVVNKVSSPEKVFLPSYGEKKHTVALIDYGAKRNISENLRLRGCEVIIFPANSSANEILEVDPDGIMLSNGPGDPSENVFQIEQIKALFGRKPIFGICLGHQLAALAAGGKTYKLKYGHRGSNQPAKDLRTGRTYITSQNHGYAVLAESISGIGEISFVNVNDNSVEGIDYKSIGCFTVQFHPEACPGPCDTVFLFDRFVEMMDNR